MENKLARYKAKNKKPVSKPKSAKKRKCDGPTCSMFLAELTRKLAHKKKQEEETENVVQTVIDSISNALPVKVSKKTTPDKKESPMKIETLQTFAPELLPNDVLNIPLQKNVEDEAFVEIEIPKPAFKMPKMPLVSSDDIKQAIEKKRRQTTVEDAAVNTGTDHDLAAELTKYVGTLRRISLIAEEFNQKTAKNLKEIVDSVQDDLLKKLEEINTEKRLSLKTEEAPSQVTQN